MFGRARKAQERASAQAYIAKNNADWRSTIEDANKEFELARSRLNQILADMGSEVEFNNRDLKLQEIAKTWSALADVIERMNAMEAKR